MAFTLKNFNLLDYVKSSTNQKFLLFLEQTEPPKKPPITACLF